MACAYTVKQVMSIYREHLNSIMSAGSTSPTDKKFMQGMLSEKELEAAVAGTVFADVDGAISPASDFAKMRLVRHADTLNDYQVEDHMAGSVPFTYVGTDRGGQHYYEHAPTGTIYIQGKDSYRFTDAAPAMLTNEKMPAIAIPGITTMSLLNTRQLEMFRSDDSSFVAAARVKPTDAVDIAKTYHDIYSREFIKNAGKVNKTARKAAKMMNDQQRDEYPTIYRDHMVKQLDYAFLFKGNEFRLKIEQLENSIQYRQRDYNWRKVQEFLYMSKLLNLRFLADETVANAHMAITRDIIYRTQVLDGTEPHGNAIQHLVKSYSKAFTMPSLEGWRNSLTIASDIAKGGMPLNSALNVELGKDGLFHGDVRASEFAANKKGIPPQLANMYSVYAKISSRASNMIDSATSSFTFEKQYYVLTQMQVAANAKLKWLRANDDVTVKEVVSPAPGTPGYIITEDAAGNRQMIALTTDVNEYHKPVVKVGDTVAKDGVLAEYHLTREGLQREVMRDFFTNSYAGAVKEATDMYRTAGILVVNNGPNTEYQINVNSPRFRRAVLDMQRVGRSHERMEVANRIAMNDFFKRPLPQFRSNNGKGNISLQNASKMELLDGGIAGVVGLTTSAIQEILQRVVRHSASILGGVVRLAWNDFPQFEGAADTLSKAIMLNAFGFIRGAANFLENMLEFTPYGYLKGGFLSSIDKTSSDLSPQDEQFFRQRNIDVYGRANTGVVMTGLILGLQAVLQKIGGCDEVNLTSDDIRDSKGLSICGKKIPLWWTGMARGNIILWNYMLNKFEGNASDFAAVLSAMSGGQIGSRDMGTAVSGMLEAKNQHEYDKSQELFHQMILQSVSDVIAGILPIPAGLIREGTSIIMPSSEIKHAPKSTFETAQWALAQSFGMKEMFLSIEEPHPMIDYRGRASLNPYLKYAKGDGIRYDKEDELLNHLGVQGQDLWNGRMRMLFTASAEFPEDEFPDMSPRTMTGEEYYNSTLATGKILDSFLKNNFDQLKAMPEPAAKQKVLLVLQDLERYSKKAVQEYSPDFYGADLKGYKQPTEEDYQQYIMDKIRGASQARAKDQYNYNRSFGKKGRAVKGIYDASEIGL